MTSRRRATLPAVASRLLALALVATSALLGFAGGAAAAVDPQLFPLPPELRDNVEFWTKIYTDCSSDQVLLHDNLHVGVIYALLDFGHLEVSTGLGPIAKEKIRQREIDRAREKYQEILEDLAAGDASPARWASDRARVERLFAEVPGGRRKYAAAADRVRGQTCMRDRFADGIERSGAYLPLIEDVFAARDLPRELTRLPFVESLFQLGARSKVAAGGIWQFMPGTAEPYLEMRQEFDERFDPLRATDAAARLLLENYNALGSWPLAITAYNHGRYGMLRAVRQVGSRDLGDIVTSYRSPTFGFASRNFYAEFLAANRAYDERAEHFPEVEPRPVLDYAELEIDAFTSLPRFAAAADLDLDLLRAMNPAIARDVWQGDLHLPAGYSLLVPSAHLERARVAYARLDAGAKTSGQVGLTYRVRPGDNLLSIARRHGTTVARLQQVNGLSSPHSIRAGQRLRIPGAGGATTATRVATTTAPAASPADQPGRPNYHVVRPGETLSGIAGRYRTSVSTIVAANRLRDAHSVRAGQRLQVPSEAAMTHIVAPGETLGAIARRYGTTVAALQASNRIDSHVIRPRQVLVIPCTAC